MVAEMGGKDAIVVDRECDLDSAVKACAASAFGYQGQNARPVRGRLWTRRSTTSSWRNWRRRWPNSTVGPPTIRQLHGAGDQRGRAKTILGYIETGKQEGRVVAGGGAAGRRLFHCSRR